MANSTGTTRKYDGHCHCGIIRFTFDIPKLDKITTCRCTFCIKNGITWNHPNPKAAITITHGEEHMTKYEFGARKNSYFFCTKCGSSLFALDKKAEEWGVNVRMLNNINIQSIPSDEYHGADLPPHYEPPTYPSPSPLGELKEGMKVYYGNCHCKAVRYTVVTKELEEQEVMRCNCSLCSRNGDYFIYPPRTSIILQGQENLTGYAFLDPKSLHSFCKICGTSMCVLVLEEGGDLMPLNVRAFNGIELEGLRYMEYDGMREGPVYRGRRHVLSVGDV